MVGYFICGLCDRKVIVADGNVTERFRVGINNLCLDCDKKITMAIIYRIIDDTSVPKTYRKMFERYLEWIKEKK
jgi:hypothetical protein